MNFVYVLKIRHSGDEDQVFLFDNMQKVNDAVFEFFQMDDQRHRGLDGFQYWLMDRDHGYFEVTTEIIR
tara:strand:- start:108 stop:314 length:207 start_codon:yes stop_codon:yes gene_type:complete